MCYNIIIFCQNIMTYLDTKFILKECEYLDSITSFDTMFFKTNVNKELDDKILGEFNGQTVTLMFRDHGHCRFLRYKDKNYYINGYKNIENLTLEEAVRIFKWDKKIDVSENECPWYTKDTL